MSSFNTGNGCISIDDQVIVGYITEEVHKIKGVSKMISSISDNFSKNIFGRDSGMNGVRINRDGDNISINLHIIVYYGYNIPQLSYEIQCDQKCNRRIYWTESRRCKHKRRRNRPGE